MHPIAKASITKYWELLKLFLLKTTCCSKEKQKQNKNKPKRHLKIDAVPLSRGIKIQIWHLPIQKGLQIQCTHMKQKKKYQKNKGRKKIGKKNQNKKTNTKSVVATIIIYVYVSEDIYTVYISTVHTCIHTHICLNLNQLMHACH